MEENKKYCIYMHKNKINGKVYIGQTCQKPEARWSNGKHYIESPHFYAAIQKYGWDNFEHIIIEENLSLEEANEKESYYIQKYNSTNDNYGYNISFGGGNRSIPQEIRIKISKALKGKTLSDEHKQKLSEAKKGAKNPNFGKHFSEERRRKIGEYQKKKVRCIETNQIFDSITEAALWAGLKDHRGLSSYLSQNRGKSCGKHPETRQPLHWEYVKE